MADPERVFVQLPNGRRGTVPRSNLDAVVAMGAKVIDDPPVQQASMSADAQPGLFSRALDATGRFMRSAHDVVDPKPVLDALTGSGQFLGKNPVQAFGQMGNSLLEAQGDQLSKAQDAWSKGDTAAAMRYGMGYLIPLLGPAANRAGDLLRQGNYAEGLGETFGLGLSVLAPTPAKMQKAGQVSVRPLLPPRLTPVEAAAVKFAHDRGIPVDLATGTGRRWIDNTKTVLKNTLGASGASRKAQQVQAVALQRNAEQLADQVYPQPVTPDVVGEGVARAIQDRAAAEQRALAANADALQNMVYPQPVSPQQAGETLRGGLQAEVMDHNTAAGHAYDVVRAAERDPANKREVQLGMVRTPKAEADLNAASMAQTGKPFDKLTPRDQQRVISLAQQVGLEVAPVPNMQTVPLPVDLRKPKSALKPTFDFLERQMPIAQQRASTGMKALGNIIAAPDHLPLSIVDADLSAIKAAARGADMPELRSLSQGLAAKAVQELEDAVQQAVSQAGPEVGAARDVGRAETAAKYRVGKVLQDLREEPVQAFAQMTYSADTGIGYLKQVESEIPKEMPKVGRAYLQSIIEEAAKDGDINGTTLLSKWQRLGPQTRATMFQNPQLVKSIDAFVQRAAAKSNIADVVGRLHSEPVRIFERLTTDNDAALAFLKQVSLEVPSEMPKVGRAFLEGLFKDAMQTGEFTGSKSLLNRWNALGPETKKILFRNPQQRQDIGNLLRLAEMQARNPNPSGTAHVLALMSQGAAALTHPVTAAKVLIAPPTLAKLMYSPRATRLLTQGAQIPIGNGAAATMAFQNIMAEIAKIDQDMADPERVFVQLPDGRRGTVARSNLDAVVKMGAKVQESERKK